MVGRVNKVGHGDTYLVDRKSSRKMKYHYITQVIIDLFGFHTKEPFIVQEIVIRILVATLRT